MGTSVCVQRSSTGASASRPLDRAQITHATTEQRARISPRAATSARVQTAIWASIAICRQMNVLQILV